MSYEGWRIGHLSDLESPWGNAGGVVRSIEEVEKMALTGVGWIEAGSYTLEARAGNGYDGSKVYDYNPRTGITQNSLGMPNKGMDEVELEIPEMVKIARAAHKRLIVNVAPVSTEPVAETRELVTRAYESGAEAVLVNLGCPNVLRDDGRRKEILSYEPKILYVVLHGLEKVVQKYPKVFVRTSPFNSYDSAKTTYRIIERSQTVSVDWTPNSWPLTPEESVLEVAGGGKSGPATAEKAYQQTRRAVEIFNGSGIEVVSSGGIRDAAELKRRLDAGAVAGAGTTFYHENPSHDPQAWVHDTDRLLHELAA